jgi:tRNA-specific 2-thiouridylase
VVRGADVAKDQSYVVHMIPGEALGEVVFPVGGMDKARVRDLAASAGLRTAAKPDSQDVCFIGSAAGRAGFLDGRLDLHPAEVVDESGSVRGEVPAVEIVTVGQRRGLGLGGGEVQYVVDVDVPARRVTIGSPERLLRAETRLRSLSWPHSGDAERVAGREVLVQSSAHGARARARVRVDGAEATVEWSSPQRRVAPGQTVVFYDETDRAVLGGGIAVD